MSFFVPGSPRINVLPAVVSAGGVATVAANTGIMTITTAPTSGTMAVGQSVAMAGLPTFACILSKLSGVMGAIGSTYQLSCTNAYALTTVAFSTNSTFDLPMPDPGYPTLEWVEKAFKTDLVDGSESLRRLGWIPVLTLKWSAYDDRNTEGWTLGGPGVGNRPSYLDLMALLDNAPGGISVSPGPTAGGFIAQSWTVNATGILPNGFAKDLQITFRGGAICSTKTLGAF